MCKGKNKKYKYNQSIINELSKSYGVTVDFVRKALALTTYRVTGKQTAISFIFKYNLNGDLKVFEIVGEPLTEAQKGWLFGAYRFPIDEEKIVLWTKMPDFVAKFKVEKIPADLSFDRLWEQYNYKMGKKDALKVFNKLKETEVIKVFLSLKGYEAHLKRTGQAKAYLATYINKEYYNNEYQL